LIKEKDIALWHHDSPLCIGVGYALASSVTLVSRSVAPCAASQGVGSLSLSLAEFSWDVDLVIDGSWLMIW